MLNLIYHRTLWILSIICLMNLVYHIVWQTMLTYYIMNVAISQQNESWLLHDIMNLVYNITCWILSYHIICWSCLSHAMMNLAHITWHDLSSVCIIFTVEQINCVQSPSQQQNNSAASTHCCYFSHHLTSANYELCTHFNKFGLL